MKPGEHAARLSGKTHVTEGAKDKRGAARKDLKGRTTKFPNQLAPMLATLTDKPIDEKGWIYEVKWDGYRALAFLNNGATNLRSRNDKSFNDKFYPVYDAVKTWDTHAIVDGEIVVIDHEGKTNFSMLQSWRSEADGDLIYYVFDLLWLNGRDLTQLPLTERRALLRNQIPDNSIIRLSENFDATGSELFALAQQMGLEGIMAKKADSPYLPGERSKAWLKIKTSKRQEVVIGGYTRNEGSGKPFSSLLAGVYEKGQFIYTGKIGTGFPVKQQKEMVEQFKPYIISNCPFSFLPDINKPSRFRPDPPKAEAIWLKPSLVCEVNYRELTDDGVMRHPSFGGMRIDKNATEVTLEKEIPAIDIITKEKKPGKKALLIPPLKASRKTLLNPAEETQVRSIGGHEIKFSNLSKIYWPEEKITKRDMLNYYYQAAPYILPYLKHRPQSLNRFPNGITGASFYQKDVTGKVPAWLNTFLYHSDTDGRDKHFLVCTDEASILYAASLGCIELNPWSSTVFKPNHPDWCIIDLDPDKNTFEQVVRAAQVTKDVLDSIGVPSYCKTSGSTGLHIYIPLGGENTYEQSKEFARSIVKMVHKETSSFTSIERLTSKRGGKMYLDFLQNRPQATIAAPYSLRPRPGATVSMPLHWEEVKKGLKMNDFTIFNSIDRIKEQGDIFKPVIGKGIDIEKYMTHLVI